MVYATSSELRRRYGAMVDQITSGDADQPGSALEDAQVEVDSYLGGAFELPLPEVPPVIVQLCCDIAIYRLLVLRPDMEIEDARKRYEDAVRRLKALRDGSLDLGLPPASAPRGIEAPILVPGAPRLFSRRSMREF